MEHYCGRLETPTGRDAVASQGNDECLVRIASSIIHYTTVYKNMCFVEFLRHLFYIYFKKVAKEQTSHMVVVIIWMDICNTSCRRIGRCRPLRKSLTILLKNPYVIAKWEDRSFQCNCINNLLDYCGLEVVNAMNGHTLYLQTWVVKQELNWKLYTHACI